MEIIEKRVGEIFEDNGKWYQCLNATCGCEGCTFKNNIPCSLMPQCFAEARSDSHSVIFKELEKIGEPYKKYYADITSKTFQKYKLPFKYPKFLGKTNTIIEQDNNNTIDIEIKQNQADMEEKIQHYDCFFDKKLSRPNLKPFDLEAAKAGKPVCTRDGRKARIICFDKKGNRPIVALIENSEGIECVEYYHEKGINLMMLPEKREGWVNVYKTFDSHMVGGLYSSKEEAEKQRSDDCVATIRIEWEE